MEWRAYVRLHSCHLVNSGTRFLIFFFQKKTARILHTHQHSPEEIFLQCSHRFFVKEFFNYFIFVFFSVWFFFRSLSRVFFFARNYCYIRLSYCTIIYWFNRTRSIFSANDDEDWWQKGEREKMDWSVLEYHQAWLLTKCHRMILARSRSHVHIWTLTLFR